MDHDEQTDEVEVELDDEEGLMQLYMQEPGSDVVSLMQREAADRLDRWHRLLHGLQRELTGQSKDLRRSHLIRLRARLFHVVDVRNWTPMQDQLHALVLGMLDEAHSHPVVQDERWLADWGRHLSEFIPGMGEMIHVVPGRPILVDTPPEQMGETELRAHADEEAKHLAEVAKEEEIRQAEMDRLQSEEDEMLKRQAALYQAWEDWEVYRHLQGEGSLRWKWRAALRMDHDGPKLWRSRMKAW